MQRLAAVLTVTALLLAGCDDPFLTGGEMGTPQLGLPIAGAMNQTWYMTNYVDPPELAGANDYQCGIKSYEGHKGTDLVLPDFARMDAGVDVVAAAPGTVVATHDGEFDRHKSWQSGVTWNVVVVDHGDDYVAYYGHLKNGSVAVAVGQEVAGGQVLGQVGSSGRSDMPHVHFEVRKGYVDGSDTGQAVDPWQGPCGAESSLWLAQLSYQDAFRVIQGGVTTDAMSLDRVKDPPTPAQAVAGGESGAVSAWIQYHNQGVGDSTVWRWRRPDGSVYGEVRRIHDVFYSMSWWWSTVSLAGLTEAGTWTVEIVSHGDVVAGMSFDVSVTGAARAAAAAPPTVDGGGLR